MPLFTKREQPDDAKTDAYRKGRQARREGLADDCPYPIGRGMNNERVHWFIGYLDERFTHLTGL